MFGKQTIEELLTLSLPKLRQLGYFVPDASVSGVIKWTIDETEIAAARVTVSLWGYPVVRLEYTHNGTPKTQEIELRWHPSNLRGNGGGYYYFVCPLTGTPCRNLYFVQGGFYGRRAFRCLYEKQAYSRRQRELFRLFDVEAQLDTLRAQPYRRRTYRGKATPYGKRLRRLEQMRDAVEGLLQ